MSERTAYSRQRSPWYPCAHNAATDALAAMGAEVDTYQRNVTDGTLRVIVTHHHEYGWRVSVTHARPRSSLQPRYPTWDEMTDARYEFTPGDVTMVMLLPPPAQYVNVHDGCLQMVELGAYLDERGE